MHNEMHREESEEERKGLWGICEQVVGRREVIAKAVKAMALFGLKRVVVPALAAGSAALTALRTHDHFEEAEKIVDAESIMELESHRARELFARILGPFLRPERSYSIGRKEITEPVHPDNLAAGEAIRKPLGFLSAEELILPSGTPLPIRPRGDVVLIGGPNSTPMTATAWEFEGPSFRNLNRPEAPIIPLRWYGISDENHPLLDRAKTALIARYRPGVGLIAGVNWPLIDTVTGQTLWPSAGEEVTTVNGQARLPLDNFLLITRLPNFLSPEFGSLVQENPELWPYIVVIEGSHGVGTRAVDLLTQPASISTLEEVQRKLGAAKSFQILFRVSDLDYGPASFRLRTVNLSEVSRLDHLDATIYEAAHKRAMRMLPILHSLPRG